MAVIVTSEGLTKAIQERLKYPGRTEAEVCNHAAYSVAHRAMMLTPFVTQEKIDTELGVATNLVLTKRGKFVRDKRKHSNTGGRASDVRDDTTLAKMIILARANIVGLGRKSGSASQSNFNASTNNRWVLSKSALKGGKAVIESFVSRMIKKRHSSTKFLVAGWLSAKKALAPFVKKTLPSPIRDASPDLGDATPAREGSWSVSAMIENAIGLQGANAKNHNKALIEHGMPALQQAMQDEEADLIRYMEEATRKKNERFNEMAR